MASGGDGDLCTVTAAIVGVGNFAIGVTPRASPAVATGGNGAEGANGSANRIECSFHCADCTDDDVSAAVSCGGWGSIGVGSIGSQAVVGGCGVAAGDGSTFGGSGAADAIGSSIATAGGGAGESEGGSGGGSEGGSSQSGRPAAGGCGGGSGSEGCPVGDLSCTELCER